jgi:hypothetical protein
VLNDHQRSWLDEVQSEGDHLVHLDGDRAIGKTTFGIGALTVLALARANTQSCIIVPKNVPTASAKNQALQLISNIENAPDPVLRSNRHEIAMFNNSKLLFMHYTPNALRGLSLDGAFIDHNVKELSSIRELLTDVHCCTMSRAGKVLVSLEGSVF